VEDIQLFGKKFIMEINYPLSSPVLIFYILRE